MPRSTQADRIRAAYARERKRDPNITPAQLAAKHGWSDGAVRSALRSTRATRGRPPVSDGEVRVHVTIPRAVHELARAEAERDGCSIESVLVAAITSGVVPPEKWLEQMNRDRG